MHELASENITPEERSAAAAAMGRVKSPAKTEAARQNAKRGGRPKGYKLSDETKAKISASRRKATTGDDEAS